MNINYKMWYVGISMFYSKYQTRDGNAGFGCMLSCVQESYTKGEQSQIKKIFPITYLAAHAYWGQIPK